MKKTLGILLGMGLTCVAQATIIAGDVIKIDFGATDTTDTAWNTGVVASTEDLVTAEGDTDREVDVALSVTAGGAFAAWTSFEDGSAQGGSADSTVYTDGIINAGTGDDNIIITFTGLDDNLTYNLFAGGVTPASDFGATWTISTTADDGTIQTTTYQNTDSYVDFTGITSVDGTFTLTINDLSNAASPADGRNVGISELTLTAIPEPATIGMLGLGTAAILAFRRRMM
jgi:hypothetical protein